MDLLWIKKEQQYLRKAEEMFKKSLAIEYSPEKCVYSQLAVILDKLNDNKEKMKKLKLAEEIELNFSKCKKIYSKISN